jgi:hypothetical protein
MDCLSLNAWARVHGSSAGAVLLTAGLSAVACGGSAASSVAGTGAMHSGGNASSSGGASSGGASSGGASSGGAGVTAPVPCFDAANQLVPEATSCEVDADCEALPTASCCGDGLIVGLATRASAYEACYPYPTGCPSNLGCASFPSTEDGQLAGFAPATFKLSCAAVDGGGKSCRTFSESASEGTLWRCNCSTGASCCAPVGDAGAPG